MDANFLDYPNATRVERKLDKERFYVHFDLSPQLKRSFVADVERFVLVNVLTSETLDFSVRSNIEEIDVLRLELKKRDYSPKILEQIARRVPRPCLFCARLGDEARFALARGRLYQTEWRPATDPPPKLLGRSLDRVWEGFVEQIALRDPRIAQRDDLDLDGKLAVQDRVDALDKEIAAAEKAVKREKQPRLKFDLHLKCQRLKAEREAALPSQ